MPFSGVCSALRLCTSILFLRPWNFLPSPLETLRTTQRTLLAKEGTNGIWPAISEFTKRAGFFYMPQSGTWDRLFYFPSEGKRTMDFSSRKNPTASVGSDTAIFGTRGQHSNPQTNEATTKNEGAKRFKSSKERVTVLCCANMKGEKRDLLVIVNSRNPWCFKVIRSLPFDYYSNANAWMTCVIFNDWLDKWDLELKRKIVLHGT
jgi:hypothetical protein